MSERSPSHRAVAENPGCSPAAAASALTEPEFSATQCAALVRAVAAHDQVDRAATLPAAVHLDYAPDLLARSFRLSRRLWTEVDRAALARLATALVRDGGLDAADLRAFKDVRARAKQLRFAAAMLDARHRYPVRLDRLTRLMGQAQDSARAGRRARARLRGAMLRALLTRRRWAALLREVDDFRPAAPAGVRDYVLQSLAPVREAVASGVLTNRSFHDVRKVVSRLVAFFDTLTVLAPSDHHVAVDRYLATVNGLMGAAHDVMAERKARSRRAYGRAAEPLPAEIADRLHALATAFLAAAPVSPRRSAIPS